MNLSTKETGLIKDLKEQEKLCVEKYTKHSSCASDTQLKNMFSNLAQTEKQHFDWICDIENGGVPATNGGNGKKPTFTSTYSSAQTPEKQNDCYLCSDVLAAEKHVSHLYDTCIFEFKDESLRNVLNTIQKQEQEHGKMIYDYMSVNNMQA